MAPMVESGDPITSSDHPPGNPETKELWDELWARLDQVTDPEIPVLTIRDLGVLRGIHLEDDEWVVTITPTYSGCPAMNTIEQDIRAALADIEQPIRIETVFSPAWTTDWLSEEGREKLRVFGIAPPAERSSDKRSLIGEEPTITCPHCSSTRTRKLSEFGSTACKALYTCEHCSQPFDYFKCI
jgi:ring-1,2-phenylacetyl-CoA epoxidase subunit PaaD